MNPSMSNTSHVKMLMANLPRNTWFSHNLLVPAIIFSRLHPIDQQPRSDPATPTQVLHPGARPLHPLQRAQVPRGRRQGLRGHVRVRHHQLVHERDGQRHHGRQRHLRGRGVGHLQRDLRLQRHRVHHR